MRALVIIGVAILGTLAASFGIARPQPIQTPALEVGFDEKDITPELVDKPVYLAGFGQNRKATKILDPLKVRAVVCKHGEEKIAIASVDVVGLFYEVTQRVRNQLPGFKYVLVCSTHNHHGPDTMGIWGPNPFTSGLDAEYLKRVEAAVVDAIKAADKNTMPVTAAIGTIAVPQLLNDTREPFVKHDELVVLSFQQNGADKRAGLIVQWNCHPETLAPKNTALSADFVGATVEALQKKHRCPVVYLTGTVGGLMTSMRVPVKDQAGKELTEGSQEKMVRFGQLVAEAADRALMASKALSLAPFHVRTRSLFVPLDNKLYLTGSQLGVLKRQAYLWMGAPGRAKLVDKIEPGKRMAIQTEVGYLQLGQLSIAAIPGEIYPELVLDKVQHPADKGADFPLAEVEPAIYKQMPGPQRMIVGLANDEIGYILPKRQWDAEPPFCYGRTKAQYGEDNSLGPDTAPVLCEAFRQLVAAKK